MTEDELEQQQPNRKRQRKPSEKCTQCKKMERELLAIELVRTRLYWIGERQLIQRKGYVGYLV